jgi:hypothetical protein
MTTRLVDTMHCPTCGAEQVWADSCRRCRCDLRLLRAAEQAYRWHRRQCQGDMLAGQFESALLHATKIYRLRSSAESCRLLALCSFLNERWLEAVQLARAAGLEPSAGGN